MNFLYSFLTSQATLGAIAILGSAAVLIPVNIELKAKRQKDKTAILESRKHLYDSLLDEVHEHQSTFFIKFEEFRIDYERVKNGGKYKIRQGCVLNYRPTKDSLEMFQVSSAFIQAYLRFNYSITLATKALNQFTLDYNPRISQEINGKKHIYRNSDDVLEWELGELAGFGLLTIELIEAMERLYWREMTRLYPKLPYRYRAADKRELKASENLFHLVIDEKLIAQDKHISKLRHPSRLSRLEE